MKTIKFLAFGLFTVAQLASAKINLEVGVMRQMGDMPQVHACPAVTLDVNESAILFHDAYNVVEAQLAEQTDKHALINFTVTSKNEAGELAVCAVPQFLITLQDEVNFATLTCEGQENIGLVVAVSKVQEVQPEIQVVVE